MFLGFCLKFIWMSMIMKNSREVVHVGLRRCYSNLQVFCVKRSESRSEEMFLELN